MRTSYFKSRTGCRTCKRRRVKCDETKPCCMRCLSGDRLCEGYGIVIDPPKTLAREDLIPRSSSSQGEALSILRPKPVKSVDNIPFLNHSESSTFELFRSKISLEIAGVRSSSFWQNVVLPACYSEPAILHASMALANASRWHRNSRGSGSLENGPVRLDTVMEYNKAIQYLKVHIVKHGDRSALRVVLITCVLFIALELRIGHTDKAMIHLDEGRKLLHLSTDCASSRIENSETEAKTLILASISSQSVEDELVWVFADLDLQSTHFGSARPQLMLVAQKNMESTHPQPCSRPFSSPILPAEFSSINEANQCLVILANECLRFVGQVFDQEWHTLENRPGNLQRQHLCTCLSNWQEKYHRLCVRLSRAEKPAKSWKEQSTFMLIRHAWLSILLPTSYLENRETDFDAYLPEFTSIVDLAGSVLLDEEKVGANGFSLEFGLVAPLWWVAMKCRHPRVRRKALRLLGCASREGLWDPRLVVQLAYECVKLEEGIDVVDEDSSLQGELLDEHGAWRQIIPLQCRISAAEVFFETDDLTMLNVTFHRKQWTSNGDFIGMEKFVRRLPFP